MFAGNFIDVIRELPPWVVLAFGLVAGGLRSMWSFVYQHTIGYAITRVSISLMVEDAEDRNAYVWLNCWVEQHLRGRKVNTLLLRVLHGDDDDEYGEGRSHDMIPAYGTYYLLFQRRLMMVEHRKESHPSVNKGRPMHSIRLQIWLCWDRAMLLRILDEARASYEGRQSMRVELFRADPYGSWFGSAIAPRSIDSVFHPPELITDLLEDIRTFLGSKGAYQRLGIPYRRGYLLSGPPGTGKSSLILAVASCFGLPIYLVPLRGAEFTGDTLARMLAYCRKPSLIALEDVDCLSVATSRESKVSDGLTMSDLLNAVDGIGAGEDRLLFMTANRPELLDPALTRAGRVDRKFRINYARKEELHRFHQRLAETRPVEPWADFLAALPTPATIADAQALAFQRTRTDRERMCTATGGSPNGKLAVSN